MTDEEIRQFVKTSMEELATTLQASNTKMINGTIAAHTKETLPNAIQEAVKPLADQLSALASAIPATPSPSPTPTPEPNPSPSPSPTPGTTKAILNENAQALAELQAKIKEMEERDRLKDEQIAKEKKESNALLAKGKLVETIRKLTEDPKGSFKLVPNLDLEDLIGNLERRGLIGLDADGKEYVALVPPEYGDPNSRVPADITKHLPAFTTQHLPYVVRGRDGDGTGGTSPTKPAGGTTNNSTNLEELSDQELYNRYNKNPAEFGKALDA